MPPTARRASCASRCTPTSWACRTGPGISAASSNMSATGPTRWSGTASRSSTGTSRCARRPAGRRSRDLRRRSAERRGRSKLIGNGTAGGASATGLRRMVTDLSKVVARLGSQNEAGHPLGLSTFVQQFGKNPVAVETFAAIELVSSDGDVTTQSRELLLLLLVEADQGAHEVARIAERALGHALLHVRLQRFGE